MINRLLLCISIIVALLGSDITADAASPVADTIVITVKAPAKGMANKVLNRAIERAAKAGNRPVAIRLVPGAEYHLSAEASTPRILRISNTTSAAEADTARPKHVGLLFENLRNVTLDGCGARFVTHGEMTPWVIIGCAGVTLRNFSIDAADPSVAEMTITEVTDSTLTARLHPRSRYDIAPDGHLRFLGEGWQFTGGIAQIYNPVQMTTLRTSSPAADALSASEIEPGLVRLTLRQVPADARPGCVYQMRHSIRNEVAGLIDKSSDITLSDINLHFMGNFGIVAQNSRNLTYARLACEPDPASRRTAAGFADFLQVSGCGGNVVIEDCRFAGSHDDPINIHGTHLRVVDTPAPSHLRVRYMHPQTWGFQSFNPGDSIAIVDAHTLRPLYTTAVSEATMISPYDIDITLPTPLPASAARWGEVVVENTTMTPEVDIRRCLFTLTPTRGILVTTRRPVRITDCEFVRCPMAAILIADDARSWYESGAVTDVTISGCSFLDCSNPVILIAPENDIDDGPVHSGIKITGNNFSNSDGSPAKISARSVRDLNISANDGPVDFILN